MIILITPHIVKDESAYAEASEDQLRETERLRVGMRRGLMPWGRERMADAEYEKAVEELNKPHADRQKALWHLTCANNLNPHFSEAIALKAKLTGREATAADNAAVRSFVRRRIADERALPPMPPQPPTTVPSDLPDGVRSSAAATQPAARPVMQPLVQPVAQGTPAPARARPGARPATMPTTPAPAAPATAPSVANAGRSTRLAVPTSGPANAEVTGRPFVSLDVEVKTDFLNASSFEGK